MRQRLATAKQIVYDGIEPLCFRARCGKDDEYETLARAGNFGCDVHYGLAVPLRPCGYRMAIGGVAGELRGPFGLCDDTVV